MPQIGRMTPADPYYPIQNQFSLIGDIEAVWDDYTGAGVRIGLYDDGIDYTHPDLAANYDASLHFTYGGITYDPFPEQTANAHGTAVGGIIAAVGNNGLGGAGVAWEATLTGVDFLYELQYFTNTTVMLEALRWAANFDIMSNSWGRRPELQWYNNANVAGSFTDQHIAVYEEIARDGRGGLGTVIVQAAGNDQLDSGGDSANATRFTLTIAATDKYGNVAYYSNFGAAILVAAPASNLSTDLPGTEGYASGDYVQGFAGTSAATPVVTGVVALMLEASPGLGRADGLCPGRDPDGLRARRLDRDRGDHLERRGDDLSRQLWLRHGRCLCRRPHGRSLAADRRHGRDLGQRGLGQRHGRWFCARGHGQRHGYRLACRGHPDRPHRGHP
jgi:subtilisin family serine protease